MSFRPRSTYGGPPGGFHGRGRGRGGPPRPYGGPRPSHGAGPYGPPAGPHAPMHRGPPPPHYGGAGPYMDRPDQMHAPGGMMPMYNPGAEAIAAAHAQDASYDGKPKDPTKKEKATRVGGGKTWHDATLEDWPKDDFRIFVGDLGNETNDEGLMRAFQKYPSCQRAKVVRDKRTNKSKGYGFVSFRDSEDFLRALKEMNGKYIGNRPVKLRKSTWKERNIEEAKKKGKLKDKMLKAPKKA